MMDPQKLSPSNRYKKTYSIVEPVYYVDS